MAKEVEGMSSAFRNLVTTYNEEYRERQFTDWVPDEGDYTVSVGKVKVGSWKNKQQNRDEPWVRVPLTIVEGPNAGKTCSAAGSRGIFTPFGFGQLGALATLLAGGEPVMDFGGAIDVLAENEGAILTIRVSKKPNKQEGGEPYTNVRFTALVAGPDAAPPAEG